MSLRLTQGNENRREPAVVFDRAEKAQERRTLSAAEKLDPETGGGFNPA